MTQLVSKRIANNGLLAHLYNNNRLRANHRRSEPSPKLVAVAGRQPSLPSDAPTTSPSGAPSVVTVPPTSSPATMDKTICSQFKTQQSTCYVPFPTESLPKIRRNNKCVQGKGCLLNGPCIGKRILLICVPRHGCHLWSIAGQGYPFLHLLPPKR